MRTAGFVLAYAALIAVAFAWIAAFVFYLRTHGSLGADQQHLRGQLFYNWLFVQSKLTGDARDNARKANMAVVVFVAGVVVAGAAFIFAVAPR
jgi:hypothetical protein